MPRRTLTLLSALVAMVLTAMPVSSGQQLPDLPPGGTFVDDDANPHEPAIEALVFAGITEGCAEDRYCPNDPMTRGQMARVLSRAFEGELQAATRDWFPDDEDSIHESEIDVIAENGITVGYPNGDFGPFDPVTRGQMATFLVRALGAELQPATRDWFPDDELSVHEDHIDIVAENGISVGFTDGTYRPTATITRAQVATMVLRALGLTPIPPPPRTPEVSVYFFMAATGADPMGEGPFLVPVARNAVAPDATVTPTVELLLQGPLPTEETGTPAITSEIPEGTVLLDLVLEDGVATVDLSAEFQSGGGSFSMLGRLAQVVFTLTQFAGVDSIDLEIEGQPVQALGGEGVVVDSYDSREELLAGTDLLPSIFVDAPARGGEAGNPLHATGWSRVFESQFTVTVTDADGLIVAEEQVLAQGEQIPTAGLPWTAFDMTVEYDVDTAQTGALIVFDTSAADGSRIAVREYPVVLSPAG